MSAPILTSGIFVDNIATLNFDKALDTSVATPLSSFSFNFGKITPISYVYLNNTTLKFTLNSTLKLHDTLVFSYQPPVDPALGLQSPTPLGANSRLATIARVQRIAEFELFNIIPPTTENKTNYNLGDSYPNTQVTSSPYSATVEDYVIAFGEKEAIQISNLDNAAAITVNRLRIERAIEDANAMIDSYIRQAARAGKLLISSSRRRTALIIARFYLDTIYKRQDVKDDYDKCLKELELLADPTRGNVDPNDPDLAMNNGGIVRVHRIPQRYNATTGLGFKGWTSDPAFDFPPDTRKGNEVLDNNTDLSNGRSYNNRVGDPQVPNDEGGSSVNGN